MVQTAEMDNVTVPTVGGHHQSSEDTKRVPSETSKTHCLKEAVARESGGTGSCGTLNSMFRVCFFSFISVMCRNYLIGRVKCNLLD